MEKIYQYRDLEQVLLALKDQVKDSIPTAYSLGIYGTPEEIFYQLKSRTTYRHDPDGNELLQETATLLNLNGRNYHGISGAGDCDCFTITALAVLYAAGYRNLFITLAGYGSQQPPVHIFPSVFLANRERLYTFDLTQDKFNTKRAYPFYQRLKFEI